MCVCSKCQACAQCWKESPKVMASFKPVTEVRTMEAPPGEGFEPGTVLRLTGVAYGLEIWTPVA